MKKTVLFLVSLYLYLICLFVFVRIQLTPAAMGDDNSSLSLFEKCFYWVWIGIAVLLLISYIINFIYAIKDFLKRDIWYSRKMMLSMKMGTIPFFIINFLFFVVVLGFIILISRGLGVILLPIVPVVVTVTYLILLLTSVYSILFLIRLRRLNLINTAVLVTHIILQLFFVVDTIASLYLAKTFSQKNFPALLSEATPVLVPPSKQNEEV